MSTKRKDRTSQGYRSSVLRRIVRWAREGKRDAVETLMASDEFVEALSRMNDYDRRVTMTSAGAAMRKLWERAPIPEVAPFALRLEWTPEMRARLRQIASRFGVRPGLDRVIAREMRLPLPAVCLARYRLVGRIRAPQPGRKRRPRGFPDAAAPERGGRSTQTKNPTCEYMERVA